MSLAAAIFSTAVQIFWQTTLPCPVLRTANRPDTSKSRRLAQPLRTIGRQFGDILQTAGLNDKTNQRKQQLLTFFGLPDAERVLAAYPHELSGGMLQRVLCAMSICCSPCGFWPTNLPKDWTKHLRRVYENLQKIKTSQSLGMLIITHDLQLARSICADIALCMPADRRIRSPSPYRPTPSIYPCFLGSTAGKRLSAAAWPAAITAGSFARLSVCAALPQLSKTLSAGSPSCL